METLGESRRVTLCRELTKRFEEAIPLTLESAVRYYRENEPRGEYVLVLAGADPEALEIQTRAAYDALSLEDHMQQYLDQGLTQKEAMRRVAADRGLSRRDIYQQLKIK
jgi:16S rRNA (cytidine1402-2'-O)-methyltransferase